MMSSADLPPSFSRVEEKKSLLSLLSSEMSSTLLETDRHVVKNGAQLSALTNLVEQQGRYLSETIKENEELKRKLSEVQQFQKVLDEAINTRIKDAVAAIQSDFNNYKTGHKIELNNLQASLYKAMQREERQEMKAIAASGTPNFDLEISQLGDMCVKKEDLKEAIRNIIRSDESVLGATSVKVHYVADKMASIEQKVETVIIEQKKLMLPPAIKRVTTGGTPRDGQLAPSSRAVTPNSSRPTARPHSAVVPRQTTPPLQRKGAVEMKLDVADKASVLDASSQYSVPSSAKQRSRPATSRDDKDAAAITIDDSTQYSAPPSAKGKSRPQTGQSSNVEVLTATSSSSSQTSVPPTPNLPQIIRRSTVDGSSTVSRSTATTPGLNNGQEGSDGGGGGEDALSGRHQDLLIRVKTPDNTQVLGPELDDGSDDFDALLSSRIRFIESRRLRTVKMAKTRYNIQTGILPVEEGENDDASVGNSVQYTNIDDQDGGDDGINNIESQLDNCELINHRIDAYTLEESDEMFERIAMLEAKLGGLELAFSASMEKYDDMKFDVDVLTNKVFSDPKVKVRRLWYRLRDDLEFGMGSSSSASSSLEPSSSSDEKVAEKKEAEEDRSFVEKLRDFTNLISVILPNLDSIISSSSSSAGGGGNPNSRMNNTSGTSKPSPSSNNNNKKTSGSKNHDLSASANTSFNGDEVDNELSDRDRELLCSSLDELTTEAENLISLDNSRVVVVDGLYTLEGLVCCDGSNKLKERLVAACRLSYEIISESIPAIILKRKIDNLERLLQDSNAEVSTKVAQLASKNDVSMLAATKADNIELQNLSDIITTQIGKLGNRDEKDAELMFKLQKHLKDVENSYRATLATKEEVNQVTTKIFGDLRQIKNNYVSLSMHNDVMPTKTDVKEYRSTIAKIFKSLSDMQDQGETDIGRMRCLVCDKVADRMTDGPPTVNPSANSTNQLYYAKPSTSNAKPNTSQVNPLFPSSSFQRLASKNPAVSSKEKAKVSTDIVVLKASVDLPPLNEALVSAMGGQPPSSPAHQYKQRIRAAIGGGMSSNYQSDVR